MATVVSDYPARNANRVLEIVEFDDMPREVVLRIVGGHGGIHGLVSLDRRAAARLGEELIRRYGGGT